MLLIRGSNSEILKQRRRGNPELRAVRADYSDRPMFPADTNLITFAAQFPETHYGMRSMDNGRQKYTLEY
jgi:hypothetical protein